jgi:hypothetical protein
MALMSAGMMPSAGLVNPTIDVAGQFQQGRQDAAVNQSNDLANEAAQLEVLATGAAYAMPQGPNGPVDPAKWNEVLDTYEASGMPPEKVKAFRDNPNMAAVLLKGSTRALSASHDAALFNLEKEKLEAEIAKAAAGGEQFRPLSADEVAKLGLPPGSYQQGGDGKISQIGGGGVNTTVQNILPGGEQGGASTTQFQKDLGGIMAKDYESIRNDAKAARTGLATLSIMEDSLNDPSFYSGFGSEQLLAVKRLGAALGIDPEGVSSMETFNALNKQAALASMGGSLGTGFSNADRDFVTGQVPTLENTPEGNRKLIEIQKKIAERKIDVSKLATAYVKKHGVLDAGFEEELQQFAEANPLFDEESGSEAAPAGDNEPAPPAIGEVVDGYEYVGGDPANEKSWKPVN